MVGAVVARVAQDLSQKPALDSEEFRSFFLSLIGESDRAVPVVAFAYFDSLVRERLQVEMNPLVRGGLAELFGASGPLGSSSAQVRVAQAMYWLRDDVSSELHILRKVRNLFAHEPFTTFEDRRVAGLLGSLVSAKRVVELPFVIRGEIEDDPALGVVREADPDASDAVVLPTTKRVEFLMAMALNSAIALSDLYVAPAAIRAGLDPRIVAEHDVMADTVGDWRRATQELLADLLLGMGVHVRRVAPVSGS